MALGYMIAVILRRSSHVFSDDRVQGRDRLLVKYVAEQMGLDGSYVPRTCIEQIQLEKLVNDVMGVISQLSEQISALNERMDEFTSRVEELNSKFSTREVLGSQQDLGLQVETCYGSVPSSLYMDGLSNGPMTGSLLPNSSSSFQLARESPVIEEVLLIARRQRQIMHQTDNLSNLLHDYWEERGCEGRTERNRTIDVESVAVPLVLMLALGGMGILLFRTMSSQKRLQAECVWTI